MPIQAYPELRNVSYTYVKSYYIDYLNFMKNNREPETLKPATVVLKKLKFASLRQG